MPRSHSGREQPATDGVKSGRSFGATFGIVCLLVGLYRWLAGGALWPWATAAAIILALTLLAPGSLERPARLWLRVGDALHRVVSPVVLALIYFGVMCPFALVMRAARRDALKLGFDKTAPTYWIARDPAGPDPDSMRNQF